ncbi:MAG: hypothetical protein E4G95_03355 [Bacteroidia bacterium]|nr:MAG: hypothetical protein E4G95_03355 [Bacteroidia bacterium]
MFSGLLSGKQVKSISHFKDAGYKGNILYLYEPYSVTNTQKMKKVVLSILVIQLLSISSFAQGIYIRAGSGYGLPAATGLIGENYNIRQDIGNIYESSVEAVKGSYGTGVNFNFAAGYKFNENFIFDLGFLYLAGRKYETYYRNIFASATGASSRTEETYISYSRGFYFNPSFVFSAGFGKQAPYARIGLIAGSPKIKREESYYDDSDGLVEGSIKWEDGGGLAVGFQTAIGVNWKITERLDIFTEASFVA